MFDVYDIDAKRHLTPKERWQFIHTLQQRTMNGCGKLWHAYVYDPTTQGFSAPRLDGELVSLRELGINNIEGGKDADDPPAQRGNIPEG